MLNNKDFFNLSYLDINDVMFADEICNVFMQNEPKVEMSLANSVNLRKRSYCLLTTLGLSSEIFGLEIAQNATGCS